MKKCQQNARIFHTQSVRKVFPKYTVVATNVILVTTFKVNYNFF